ncbi:MAG: DUF4159 domain-containing protein [Bacteroidetes bacterium]|nr:MAG: DUF4159 domain-containing protein [Bacteroidota bacterium]
MRRTLFLALVLLALPGCDSVYHYVMFPPQREEHTLIPRLPAVLPAGKGTYRIGDDKQTIVYDAKDFKVEIKYMTDYQLNTFEFPEQSRSGQYSTNPFTYGDWVDPELGYIPNRFTVFKVSIYNYAGGKLNFDPENATLFTDRGDQLPAFAREEKGARNYSLEAYFKRRKGTSGIDDDVFESRMGIVRRNVHYLGKPIFRGDVRDGLVVFDPLVEEVEQVKVTMKDFILGYDENNQASEFEDIAFYFTKRKFESPAAAKGAGADTLVRRSRLVKLDPSARPAGEVKIAVKTTNVSAAEAVMAPLTKYFSAQTDFKVTVAKTDLLPAELARANILLVFAEEGQLKLSREQAAAAAEFVKNGGFIVADERSMTVPSENWTELSNFLSEVVEAAGSNAGLGRVPSDHPVFSMWKRFEKLPAVDATLLNVEAREEMEYLNGLYVGNRLAGFISNRGYSVAWGEFGTFEARDGVDFTNQRDFLANVIYYAIESAKIEKNK